LPLRITVVAPPPDVWFSLQPEPGVFEQRVLSTGSDLVFDLELRVGDPTPSTRTTPRLLGPHVKGPPDKRFVYIGVGKHAGDPSSCWDRRIKVPLTQITSELLQAAHPGQVLNARVAGRAGDGGPACATVPLLPPGWTWQPARWTTAR
jgi:hypothetical protein